MVICETMLEEGELLRKVYLAGYEKEDEDRWFYNPALAPEAVAAKGTSLYYGDVDILADAIDRLSEGGDVPVAATARELAAHVSLYPGFVMLGSGDFLFGAGGGEMVLVTGELAAPERARLRLVSRLARERFLPERLEEIRSAMSDSQGDTAWRIEADNSLRNWLVLELEAEGEMDIFGAELIDLRI